ncbi:unnamed protein product, partial [Amoebophrya sp. A25]|eukprot:GSA25T00001705001.1
MKSLDVHRERRKYTKYLKTRKMPSVAAKRKRMNRSRKRRCDNEEKAIPREPRDASPVIEKKKSDAKKAQSNSNNQGRISWADDENLSSSPATSNVTMKSGSDDRGDEEIIIEESQGSKGSTKDRNDSKESRGRHLELRETSGRPSSKRSSASKESDDDSASGSAGADYNS